LLFDPRNAYYVINTCIPDIFGSFKAEIISSIITKIKEGKMDNSVVDFFPI